MPNMAASNFKDRFYESCGQRILGVSVFALSLCLAGNLTPYEFVNSSNVLVSDPITSTTENNPVKSVVILQENNQFSDIKPQVNPIVYPRVKPQPSIKIASYSSPMIARVEPPNQPLRSRAGRPANPSLTLPQSSYDRLAARQQGPRLSDRKLFGSVEIQFEDEKKIRSWANSYAGFVRDTQALRQCVARANNCQNTALASWAAELRSIKGQSRLATLNNVNARVNRRPYISDSVNYARSDYWASPNEFLQKSGDCEDFALMKFASLLALGFDNKDMRLVIGSLSDGTPHAVLTVNVGTTEYVLDNRQSIALSANVHMGYTPKYSMNLTDRWSHIMPETTLI